MLITSLNQVALGANVEAPAFEKCQLADKVTAARRQIWEQRPGPHPSATASGRAEGTREL